MAGPGHRQAGIRTYGYIDVFAGAGVALSRDASSQLHGSPLNALHVRPAFSEYHFIEIDPGKAGVLERLVQSHPNAHTYVGDHDAILKTDVLPRFTYPRRARAICLLDPYGLSVKWSLVSTVPITLSAQT